MVHFRHVIIFLLLVHCSRAAIAADDAAALLQSLYGDRISKVTATTTKTDDVALAKEMVDAAAQVKDNLSFLAVMCDTAHELAMRHRDGYAVAVQALELLCSSDAPNLQPVQMKLLDTYQKQLTTVSRDEKAKLGEITLTLFDDLTRQLLAKREYSEAAVLVRRAISVAATLGNPQRVADFKAKLAGLIEFERTQRRVAQLSERVLKDAGDQQAMEEMVRLMIVDLDDAPAASPYVPRLTEGDLKKVAALAIKPAGELTATDRLALGEWFHGLATQQKPSPAYAWLRAEEHLLAFLDVHTAADLLRTKATIKLNEVQQGLAKGAADNIKELNAPKAEPMVILSARFGGGANWTDCTQRFKTYVFNNTLVAWANPEWCGPDPTPGWRKKLHLRYRIGGKIVDRWFDEDSRLFIYEGPPLQPTDDLNIISACYGQTSGLLDVTYHIRRGIRKNRLDFTVIPKEWNTRDPRAEKGGTLFITYSVKGKLHLTHAGENGKISIPAPQ